jgi:hypothetical protein
MAGAEMAAGSDFCKRKGAGREQPAPSEIHQGFLPALTT